MQEPTISNSTHPVQQINNSKFEMKIEPFKTDKAKALFGQLLLEINQRLGAGAAFDQILDFIFDSLGLLIPYDRIGIALLDESNTRLQLTWVRSKVPVSSLTKNYSAPLVGSLKRIIDTDEPRIINDLNQYLESHPNSESTRLILKDGIKANLTCPLRSHNKPIGVVFFSSCNPNTYQNDHVQTFLAIANELSVIVEQARLKKYFDEEESRQKVFSRVIHDLRSPLSVIQGYIDLAKEEKWYGDLPADAKNICMVLQRNAGYMLSLLEELLELRQAKSSATPLKIQKVNLRDFILAIAESGRVLSAHKEIGFVFLPDPHLAEFSEMDPAKIRRALDNLISNAIKFSKRGTTIKMSVTAEKDRLVFEISDQGQGIAEEEIPKLFSEFGRTLTSPTEGESSTGLGLAIVKGIVEKHGGQISVTSKLNQGSTFTFWIPQNHYN